MHTGSETNTKVVQSLIQRRAALLGDLADSFGPPPQAGGGGGGSGNWSPSSSIHRRSGTRLSRNESSGGLGGGHRDSVRSSTSSRNGSIRDGAAKSGKAGGLFKRSLSRSTLLDDDGSGLGGGGGGDGGKYSPGSKVMSRLKLGQKVCSVPGLVIVPFSFVSS